MQLSLSQQVSKERFMTRRRRNPLNHGHRRILDDNWQPLKPGPSFNTKRKRKYYAKDDDRSMAWYRFEMHKRLHPDKPYKQLSSEQAIEAMPEKQQSQSNQRRREKRARGRAEKRVQP